MSPMYNVLFAVLSIGGKQWFVDKNSDSAFRSKFTISLAG